MIPTMAESRKSTDSIPRASIPQIFDVLISISHGATTFDQVRVQLQARSGRRSPATRQAMWTVARDTLSDLHKLGFITAGILPRKRSDLDRLRESPCSITERGSALASLFVEKPGRAFDELLLVWMNEHLYFHSFMARLLRAPLYVPDITSANHLGPGGQRLFEENSLADKIVESCGGRLRAIGFLPERLLTLERVVRERVKEIQAHSNLRDLDPKRRIDAVEDLVLLPAFLAAEDLPFDAVTFQHLLKVSQDFFSASWTSSHPAFSGRVMFATCEFRPNVLDNSAPPSKEVIHHGHAFAADRFFSSLLSSYRYLAGPSGAYVDAYTLRAVVCVELAIQPKVFGACLESLLASHSKSNITIYTELPFVPPPQGEDYLEIGKRRIGRLKLVEQNGV
jgi:hypothetical protein